MTKYDDLIKANKEEAKKEEKLYSLASQGIKEGAKDEKRISNLYNNADVELQNIDEQFRFETGFNKTDVSFLMLATALQICRWIVIGVVNEKFTAKINSSRLPHDDEKIKKMEK